MNKHDDYIPFQNFQYILQILYNKVRLADVSGRRSMDTRGALRHDNQKDAHVVGDTPLVG